MLRTSAYQDIVRKCSKVLRYVLSNENKKRLHLGLFYKNPLKCLEYSFSKTHAYPLAEYNSSNRNTAQKMKFSIKDF